MKDVSVYFTTARPLESAYVTIVASREADMRFSVAGEVNWISPDLRNGVKVKEGVPLVRLDTTRYQLALDELRAQIAGEKAQIASLEKQLSLRLKTLERTKRMPHKMWCQMPI